MGYQFQNAPCRARSRNFLTTSVSLKSRLICGKCGHRRKTHDPSGPTSVLTRHCTAQRTTRIFHTAENATRRKLIANIGVGLPASEAQKARTALGIVDSVEVQITETEAAGAVRSGKVKPGEAIDRLCGGGK